MKRIKDILLYKCRWDSLGVNCVFCKYHVSKGLPITYLCCKKYSLSLNIELCINKDGIAGGICGEWFCKDFEDDGNACPDGIKEFEKIKDQLEENVLYEACQEEYLCMIPFSKLPKDDCNEGEN